MIFEIVISILIVGGFFILTSIRDELQELHCTLKDILYEVKHSG